MVGPSRHGHQLCGDNAGSGRKKRHRPGTDPCPYTAEPGKLSSRLLRNAVLGRILQPDPGLVKRPEPHIDHLCCGLPDLLSALGGRLRRSVPYENHGLGQHRSGRRGHGGAYAAWSYGVIRGNITLLAIASYFTPVLSCLFATLWIGASLDGSLWTGVGVLVLGSLLCWSATYFHK